MIKSFRHKGVQKFYETGSKAGIQPAHAPKLARQLKVLDAARSAEELDVPGWRFHALAGDLTGHWAVWVDRNWRLPFTFEGEDAVLVDYQDYH